MARHATKVDEKPARGEDAANGIGRGGRSFNRAAAWDGFPQNVYAPAGGLGSEKAPAFW